MSIVLEHRVCLVLIVCGIYDSKPDFAGPTKVVNPLWISLIERLLSALRKQCTLGIGVRISKMGDLSWVKRRTTSL
jgi:hypothetical protein